MSTLNNIQQLLTPWNNNISFKEKAFDLANSLGWYPSDVIEEIKPNSLATGHLFVEYGLENTAVISFINNKNVDFSERSNQQINLFSLSYNNLIDYHLTVETNRISAFHNRIKIDNNLIYTKETSNFKESLSSDFFTKFIYGKNLKPNMKALDDMLIDTISYWKRYIYSELNGKISNEELSNFFNAIIFVRALEDSKKINEPKLTNTLQKYSLEQSNFTDIISKSLNDLNVNDWPQQVINRNLLTSIDKLDSSIFTRMISNFYFSTDIPYQYDFSVISKHALSRIYEKYVSIINTTESVQLNLFDYAPNPKEEPNKATGSYYTPQFIARFFSRYIDKLNPDISNKTLNILEPSVGSGIFLRTVLEYIVEKNSSSFDTIKMAFQNVVGIDKNKTACDATNLSLTLLHLISTGELPDKTLSIINEDTLEYFKNSNPPKCDIVISNPPFIKWNSLTLAERELMKSSLGDCSFNKSDLYLAFIKIAIDNLKNKGLGLFVLPSTFLITDSAKLLRKYISDTCTVKCIVDLSGVEYKIFDEADIYPILFIFQKGTSKSDAKIANIHEHVGKALTDLLNDKIVKSNSYSIYDIPQSFFREEKWHLLSPEEMSFKASLLTYPKLKDFCEIRTGFASGNTNAFIIPRNKIPSNESLLYKPYLTDREMEAFNVPVEVTNVVFYPQVDGKLIDESVLKEKYAKTYKRLFSFYNELNERKEVQNGRLPWWRPNRSRNHDFMFVPKIVTPHLIFTPKFSLDIDGIFAISRAPFIVVKKNADSILSERELLIYLLGLLNSQICVWHILNHSPKYQNGYAMIEPSVLGDLPIPSPYKIDKNTFIKFTKLIKERLLCNKDMYVKILELEKEINDIALSLYDLTEDDKQIILG